jgi:dihydroorotate dehydrogenase (NAD+) catalytic subunit
VGTTPEQRVDEAALMSPAGPGVQAFGTTFPNPVLLAAGTAGFGREVAQVTNLARLGGLVTKAVTPEPRAGAPSPRVAEFGGGMLNAVGLANPGVDSVRRVELPWLAKWLPPGRAIVNVAGSGVDDYVRVLEHLDGADGFVAFELNASCPNTSRGGLEFGADPRTLRELVSAARRTTRKPLIVKLSPVVPDVAALAEEAAAAGADGFTCVNTIPGTLYRERDGGAGRRARLGLGPGGVSGPALLAVGTLATERVVARTGLPVIGVGGIRSAADARQYLAAGATLVAVGTASLADPRAAERIADGLARRPYG